MAELGNKCTSPDAKSIVGQLSSAPACSSADLSGPLLGVSPARKSVCSHSYLREPTRAGNVLRFSGSSAPPDFSMLSTMHSGTPGTGTKLRCCSCVFPSPCHTIDAHTVMQEPTNTSPHRRSSRKRSSMGQKLPRPW